MHKLFNYKYLYINVYVCCERCQNYEKKIYSFQRYEIITAMQTTFG